MQSGRGSKIPSPPQHLKLKIVPRAARNEVIGWLDERLKLRIAAVPEKGRANAALEVFLADLLGVPKRSVRVVAGAAATDKRVEIRGLSRAELLRRLPARR